MGVPVKTRPELGKWALWKFFSAVPALRPHLPETAKLSKTSFRSFMEKHGAVYLKPSPGQQGKGIIKAWKKEDRYWFVKERSQPISAKTLDALYTKIRPYTTRALYIVQAAIHLAEVDGRPFDIRLMMMRDSSGKWQYAGMVAKVAGQGSVVTNVALGKGYVLEVENALRRSLGYGPDKIETVKQELIKLGQQVVHRFDEYKKYWQIGLDVAIDKHGKIWIIEENTGPAHGMFNKIQDKTMFRKIRSIAAYWRSGKRSRRKIASNKKRARTRTPPT